MWSRPRGGAADGYGPAPLGGVAGAGLHGCGLCAGACVGLGQEEEVGGCAVGAGAVGFVELAYVVGGLGVPGVRLRAARAR